MLSTETPLKELHIPQHQNENITASNQLSFAVKNCSGRMWELGGGK
jgi:hypothetical protein